MRQLRTVSAFRASSSPYRLVIIAADFAEAREIAAQWASETHGKLIEPHAWIVKRTRTVNDHDVVVTGEEVPA
jgi:hypothetical protein